MRINSINSVNYSRQKSLPIQKQPQQVVYQNNPATYATNSVSPSFNGFIFKKTLPEQVISKLEKIANKGKKDDYFANITRDLLYRSIKRIKPNLSDDTAPFVNKLVDRIKDTEYVYTSPQNDFEQIRELTEFYNKFPNARSLMDKAADAIDEEGQQRFNIQHLDNIFGRYYNASEQQNAIINEMLDAKGFNGKYRFFSDAFCSVERGLAKSEHKQEAEEALRLILAETRSKKNIDVKKLTKLLQESEMKDVTSTVEQARLPEETHYLFEKDGFDIDEALRLISSGNMPVFKKILPYVSNGRQISPILKQYTPEKLDLLNKSLKLVDEKQITIDFVPSILRNANAE